MACHKEADIREIDIEGSGIEDHVTTSSSDELLDPLII
jgi:hypothetical protein